MKLGTITTLWHSLLTYDCSIHILSVIVLVNAVPYYLWGIHCIFLHIPKYRNHLLQGFKKINTVIPDN